MTMGAVVQVQNNQSIVKQYDNTKLAYIHTYIPTYIHTTYNQIYRAPKS